MIYLPIQKRRDAIEASLKKHVTLKCTVQLDSVTIQLSKDIKTVWSHGEMK